MWVSYTVAVLFCLINIGNTDYIGAVVEYQPLQGPTANTTLEENLKNYIYHIEQAKTLGAQILVFPEYGLTTLVTDPENYSIPVPNVGTTNFSEEAYTLLKLANAAIEHQMYIVVNLLESVNASESNTTYYHNTNVVFSSNGTLVAKHRKMNLYKEPKITPGKETTTFKTDFGTFAVFTCMDILFYNSSQAVLENTGVTDVVFPTGWFSHFPFYMALSVQYGYALANKVNLLAANINLPSQGLGGSSIISSDGTVLRTILTDMSSNNIAYANLKPSSSSSSKNFELMGFDIFRNETRQPLSNFANLTAFEYEKFTYKTLNLSAENVAEEICDGDFCCNFNIVMARNETNTSEVYRLAAYKGSITSNDKPGSLPIKVCALLGCVNEDISSCGVWPPTAYSTIFRQMTVWGNWETQPDQFFRPTGIRGNWEPFYNATYLENKTNETVGVSFNTTRPFDNVVAFGLYATGGGSIGQPFSLFVMVFMVVCLRMFRV